MLKKISLHSAFILVICSVSFITGFNAGFSQGIRKAWEEAKKPSFGSVVVTIGLPFAPMRWRCQQINSTENSADMQCWEYNVLGKTWAGLIFQAPVNRPANY